jgi:hypothetical protein
MSEEVAARPIGAASGPPWLYQSRLTAAMASGRIAAATASTGVLVLTVGLIPKPADQSWTSTLVVCWLAALTLARLLRSLLERSSYRGGMWLSMTRDYLFATSGWVISLGSAWWLGAATWRILWTATIDTSLQSLVLPAVVCASLLIATGCALAVRRVPVQFAKWRLRGLISESAARDIIAVSLLTPVLQFVWLIDIVQLPDARETMDYGIPLTFLAVVVFGVAQIISVALRKKPDKWGPRVEVTQGPLQGQRLAADFHVTWLVVDWPIKTRADRRLVSWIARKLKLHGPFVCVSPLGSTLISEHYMLADRLGQLAAIFPRSQSGLRDWRATLPPDSSWTGLPFRQLHPDRQMMTEAIVALRAARDAVLLLARRQTNLDRWAGLLPADLTKVVLVTDGIGLNASSIVGYPLVQLDGTKMQLHRNLFGKLEYSLSPYGG